MEASEMSNTTTATSYHNSGDNATRRPRIDLHRHIGYRSYLAATAEVDIVSYHDHDSIMSAESMSVWKRSQCSEFTRLAAAPTAECCPTTEEIKFIKRRRKRRRAESAQQDDERFESRRTRPITRVKEALRRRESFEMRPNWRQLALVGLLSILVASVLALFAGPSWTCFSHCHALTLTNQTAAAASVASTTLAPVESPITARSPLMQQATTSSAPSSIQESATLLAPTLSPLGSQRSTTTTATAATTTLTSTTTPAATSSQRPSVLASSTIIESNTSAAKKVSAALRSQLRYQQQQQQPQQIQLVGQSNNINNNNNSNRSSYLLQDNSNNGGQQRQQKSSSLNNNYQRTRDNNNAWQPTSGRGSGSGASGVGNSDATDIRVAHLRPLAQPPSVLSSITTSSRGDFRGDHQLGKQQHVPTQTATLEQQADALKVIQPTADRSQQQQQLDKAQLASGWSTVETEFNDKILERPSNSNSNNNNNKTVESHSRPANVELRSESMRRVEPTVAMRRQFMPSGVMLHSLVREALNELMSSGHSQEAAAHQLLSSALASAAAARGGLVQQLAGRPEQSSSVDKNGQLSMENSQSAPSVSLPPLSHFLVPRNPFRLFSSSSTPIVSRYRPPFTRMPSSEQQQSSASRPHQTTSSGGNGMVSWIAGVPMSTSNHQRAPPFQGQANLAGMDELLATALSSSNLMNSNGPANGPKLYAHSHSAEQLEKLIRAASRQTGMRSPTILPAIVSAPNGPMPGFYIPAIESESESQISEFRHGEMPAASNVMQANNGPSVMSKIPGTDYLLHPDEVRAMINMGELAWRKQHQQHQHQHQHQVAESSSGAGRWQPVPQQQQQQPLMQPYQQMAANLMQENHAQNARDFAYVDPQTRRDNPNHHQQLLQQQADSSMNEQRIYQNHPRMNTSELETQLSNHFRHARMSSFPAVIRVNDQDYVHWPLLNNNNNNNHRQQQQQQPSVDQMRLAAASHRPLQTPFPPMGYQMPLRGHMFAFGPSQAADLMGNHNHLLAHQESRHTESTQLRKPAADLPPEKDPVRLATQLTPVEIRQVEDSILEALIMAQTMQNQQRLMRLAEAASLNRPAMIFPVASGRNNINNNNNKKVEQHQQKGGFFSRRRRSRRHQTSKQQQQQQNQMSESPSQPQLMSLLPPWLNISSPAVMHLQPIPLLPLFQPPPPPASSEQSAADTSEPLMIESKSQQRLPVVIADQDTNKPKVLLGAESSDAIQIFETAEASEPKVSTVLLNPAERIKMHMMHQSGLDGSASTFGARVMPLSRQKQLDSRSIDSRPTESNNDDMVPASIHFPDATRVHHQQGPHSSIRHMEQNGRGSNRINVDWPGMVSDADYFPSSERSERLNKSPTSTMTSAEGARDHTDHKLIFRSSASAGQNWNPLQTEESSRPSAPQRPEYVTSQLKLQFSPDYRAREGVPIYNNNVRVAGALDREQRVASMTIRQPQLLDPAGSGAFPPADDEEDSEESVAISKKHSTSPVVIESSTATSKKITRRR